MQTQIIRLILPKDLAKRADRLAKKEYKNMSELIHKALRIYLARLA